MWTAVSGAMANLQQVDTVSNNLANQDTTGFKKDLPTFKEYLVTNEREHQPEEVQRGPIKDKEFYPLDGKDQAFVVTDATYTNFKPGPIRVTKSPLDFALDGPGFFEVSTPVGIRYTRNGSLKVAMDGRLVTSEGYPVLTSQPGGLATALPATASQPNQGGFPTQGGVAAGPGNPVLGSLADPATIARQISLKDRTKMVSISDSGEIYSGDQLLGKMNIVEFEDVNKLRKEGGQLFVNMGGTLSAQPQRTVVKQGMIEGSNVNPIEEMVNLIKANRTFEHSMKAIKTYNDVLGREANDIGKL